jgi:hypothetical protein
MTREKSWHIENEEAYEVTYGLLATTGILSGLLFYFFRMRSIGWSHCIAMSGQALAGAWIGALLFKFSAPAGSGYSVRGALLLMGLTTLIYCIRYRISFLEIANGASQGLALTEFLIRAGCVFSGCCADRALPYLIAAAFAFILTSVARDRFKVYLVSSGGLRSLAALLVGASPLQISTDIASVILGILIIRGIQR